MIAHYDFKFLSHLPVQMNLTAACERTQKKVMPKVGGCFLDRGSFTGGQ